MESNVQLYGSKNKKICSKLITSLTLNESFRICYVDIFPEHFLSDILQKQINISRTS